MKNTPSKPVIALSLLTLLGAALAAQKDSFVMVYDAGGKFDKSFNQSAYEGAKRAAKDLGLTQIDYEPEKQSDLDRQVMNFGKGGYALVTGVGFQNNERITKAALTNPDNHFALVDDVSTAPNVASILFKEEEGSFLVGYIAAKTSATGKIGFLGGMETPLIYRFASGFKAGVKAANPKASVVSAYVGKEGDYNAWNNPTEAYRLSGVLRKKGVDIIYAAAGNSGSGVINYVKDTKCIKKAELPAGMTFTHNNFSKIPKNARYQAACKGDTRPMFFIGVDSNQNYLGDDDNNPKTLNYGLTSMVKRVDNAMYAVLNAQKQGSFKGGKLLFGLKEGGVSYAVDQYNMALLSPELRRSVEQHKTRIIRSMIRVPVK